MKRIVPANVAIIRHYRVYVPCEGDEDDQTILRKAVDMICDEQDLALTPDPDLEIEGHEIMLEEIDWDGVQFDWEDEE